MAAGVTDHVWTIDEFVNPAEFKLTDYYQDAIFEPLKRLHGDESAGSGYTNLITVTTQAGTGRKIIAGTVFDGTPRIVRLRDLHIEFIPEGHILVLSYEDRPGMVGKIGSILGRHNVNIASMHVGRRTRRGGAIVVLLLDEAVSPEVMEEVAKAVEADFTRLIRLDA